jgi:cation diffusion facilitator CzcD-associated flavoprotein CzcO
MDEGPDVVVIGSGPAGLSCAAELVARGVATTVLERGDGVGAAWAGRYDALRFNTCRLHSALPGSPFPREFGLFPTRDQYVSYLRTTQGGLGGARYRGDRAGPVDGGGWRLATNRGGRLAEHVVVATGAFNRPQPAYWAGREDTSEAQPQFGREWPGICTAAQPAQRYEPDGGHLRRAR